MDKIQRFLRGENSGDGQCDSSRPRLHSEIGGEGIGGPRNERGSSGQNVK